MMHYKQPPKKPLFTDQKEAEMFLSLFNDFDEEIYIRMAKALYVEGLTTEEVAESIGYSKRQTERLRIQLLKVALKRAIRKLANGSDTE